MEGGGWFCSTVLPLWSLSSPGAIPRYLEASHPGAGSPPPPLLVILGELATLDQWLSCQLQSNYSIFNVCPLECFVCIGSDSRQRPACLTLGCSKETSYCTAQKKPPVRRHMTTQVSAQKRETTTGRCVMHPAAGEKIKRTSQKTAVQSPNDSALTILYSIPKNSRRTLYVNPCTPAKLSGLNLGFWPHLAQQGHRLPRLRCGLSRNALSAAWLCSPTSGLPLLAVSLALGNQLSWHPEGLVCGARQVSVYLHFLHFGPQKWFLACL